MLATYHLDLIGLIWINIWIGAKLHLVRVHGQIHVFISVIVIGVLVVKK